MAKNSLSKVFDHLRHVLPLPGEDTLSDNELLTRFISNRDQPAFAALLRRHGRMVMAVCQQVLRHTQDAEDAFQATFLLLSRKAKTVAKRATLGGFLYEAAHRTALKARSLNMKRQRRERPMENMPPNVVAAEEIQDWRDVLYQELHRLPPKYREPIVLCDLEGQPRKRVAGLLKVPEGTLSSRLARARKRLAQRLSRKGVVLSVGTLASVLAQETASAQMIPASLIMSTTKAATLVAAGKLAEVSIPAGVLLKGVLQAMLLTKLKVAAAILLAMGVVLGAGGFAYRSEAVQATPLEDELLKELKALRRDVELLKANLQLAMEKIQAQEGELHRIRTQTGAAARGTTSSSPTMMRKPTSECNPPPLGGGFGSAVSSRPWTKPVSAEPLKRPAAMSSSPIGSNAGGGTVAPKPDLQGLQPRGWGYGSQSRPTAVSPEPVLQGLQQGRPGDLADSELRINRIKEMVNKRMSVIEQRNHAQEQERVKEALDTIEKEIQNLLETLDSAKDEQTKQHARAALQKAMQRLDELSNRRKSLFHN